MQCQMQWQVMERIYVYAVGYKTRGTAKGIMQPSSNGQQPASDPPLPSSGSAVVSPPVTASNDAAAASSMTRAEAIKTCAAAVEAAAQQCGGSVTVNLTQPQVGRHTVSVLHVCCS